MPGASPPPSGEPSAHHRTQLPAFPLCGTRFGASLEPGVPCLAPASPQTVSSSGLWTPVTQENTCSLPHTHPAAHLPTANAVTPMVRFSGWYMSCRSSGSKVPSETMGANQGVSVSSSVGLSAGGAAGAETLPSGKPQSHPGPASHAV